MLARLVGVSGGTAASGAIAAVLFAGSGPAIEAFYTLSKAEPLQAAWMGLSLLATGASARTSGWSLGRAAWLAAATATALLAHATKETSLVLVGIALGWVAIEWRAREAGGLRFATSFLFITGLAAVTFLALRWRFAELPLAEGTYTRAYAIQLSTVGPALFRIAGWLLRDFAWLLAVSVAAVVLATGAGRARRRPVLYASVWMLGWIVVYLPWPATFAYYLLPFALGAAALGGIVLGAAWSSARPRARWLLATTALLWVPTVVNAVTDARVQLAVDRANAHVVDFLGTLPRDGRVVLNMTPWNEYHFELPLHLVEIKHRPDILFVDRLEQGARSNAPTFVLTPEMADPPMPTVRIALREAGVRRDNAALAALVPDGGAVVYRAGQRIAVVEVGLQRLLCPLALPPVFDPTFCPRDRGVIVRRTFLYGWQVHRAANAGTMAHGH
jgi:hypothetical protein